MSNNNDHADVAIRPPFLFLGAQHSCFNDRLPRMAQTATLHHFTVQLADMDRGIYADFELRVARQPSETAELILEAYEWHTSRAGGARGAVMLGDEMIDEASRKMALVISAKGRAAGMQRTDVWTAPEG